ncbi:MAG: hypothetical protein FWE85_06305 [Clostridiales bacterium]|nr:hypothetical protein [Clostridiales bacterium]
MTELPQENTEIKAELADICAKMREYLKMSGLLPFSEFEGYFKRVMAFLQEQYQDLGREQLLLCKRVCKIVRQNAQNRAPADSLNRKKFRKMEEKCEFWAGAIELRLFKEGMSVVEIDDAERAVWDSPEPL